LPRDLEFADTEAGRSASVNHRAMGSLRAELELARHAALGCARLEQSARFAEDFSGYSVWKLA
jgi:hypothetical protein